MHRPRRDLRREVPVPVPASLHRQVGVRGPVPQADPDQVGGRRRRQRLAEPRRDPRPGGHRGRPGRRVALDGVRPSVRRRIGRPRRHQRSRPLRGALRRRGRHRPRRFRAGAGPGNRLRGPELREPFVRGGGGLRRRFRLRWVPGGGLPVAFQRGNRRRRDDGRWRRSRRRRILPPEHPAAVRLVLPVFPRSAGRVPGRGGRLRVLGGRPRPRRRPDGGVGGAPPGRGGRARHRGVPAQRGRLGALRRTHPAGDRSRGGRDGSPPHEGPRRRRDLGRRPRQRDAGVQGRPGRRHRTRGDRGGLGLLGARGGGPRDLSHDPAERRPDRHRRLGLRGGRNPDAREARSRPHLDRGRSDRGGRDRPPDP
mmetsp:Transcript_2553/g.6909  ORF Transcript_2553/g.6909 Transcript_2553/m.6909 type:complete len:366 (+) Transcript_2553:1091-2188(+)